MRIRLFAAGAVLGLLVSGGATIMAQAQTYENPNLPRSPYALPEPTYRGDDEERQQPYPWRHWGDSRNNGELAYELLAPNGVLDGGYGAPVAASPPDRAHARFCRRHPDACEQ